MTRAIQRSDTAPPGRSEHSGGLGGPFEAPMTRAIQRSDTAPPGRSEHSGGLGGPFEAPHLN